LRLPLLDKTSQTELRLLCFLLTLPSITATGEWQQAAVSPVLPVSLVLLCQLFFKEQFSIDFR